MRTATHAPTEKKRMTCHQNMPSYAASTASLNATATSRSAMNVRHVGRANAAISKMATANLAASANLMADASRSLAEKTATK